MKKSLYLSSALVLGVLSHPVSAGGMAEPVMEPEVVRSETALSGSHDFLVPLMALIMFAAAASNGNAPVPVVSDRRCKTDIRAVGMTPQGLALYHWRYPGLDGVWQGVMADEVAVRRPEALVRLPFGIKAVDYRRLGLESRRVT
ncbi:hypothetical protein [Neotabrizicola sp. sgz301269]|uniref:hypothetical protein n=1 Tax=Neotabrizicola sp. sgz301269 TaxID=3276282 RepID=UPI0037705E82